MRFICFICVFISLFFFFWLFSDKKSLQKNDYLAAIHDKHMILKNIENPAVILAGGSNVAFGIDSLAIEKKIGFPVVNLGLHAGLGLDFMLEELKFCVRPGDFIILSTEYFLNRAGSYPLKILIKGLYPMAGSFFEEKAERKKLLLASPELPAAGFLEWLQNFRRSCNNRVEDPAIYNRKSFNSRGDLVAHLNSGAAKNLNSRALLPYYQWEGIEWWSEKIGQAYK